LNGATVVCPLEALAEGTARACTVGSGTAARRIVVVRREDRVFAYLNRCPHEGIPLDWSAAGLLDREGRHLICNAHAALFEVEDGFCVEGPCAGDSLEAIPVSVTDGMILLSG